MGWGNGIEIRQIAHQEKEHEKRKREQAEITYMIGIGFRGEGVKRSISCESNWNMDQGEAESKAYKMIQRNAIKPVAQDT